MAGTKPGHDAVGQRVSVIETILDIRH